MSETGLQWVKIQIVLLKLLLNKLILSDFYTDDLPAVGILFNNGFLLLITSAEKPGHEIIDKLFHHPTHDKVKIKRSIFKVLFTVFCYFLSGYL